MNGRNPNVKAEQLKEQITVGQDEEAILLKKDGTVSRSVLPGQKVKLTEETPYLYRIPKGIRLGSPAGYGQLKDADGGIWNCCAEFTCQLKSARRYALRNGARILEGIQDEKILRDLIREKMKECLTEEIHQHNRGMVQDAGGENAFWQKVTERVCDQLLDNGWGLISLVPENLRRGTHEDTYL